MAFKHKYTFEEKQRIVTEYLNNTNGFRELCRIYGMSQESFKNWVLENWCYKKEKLLKKSYSIAETLIWATRGRSPILT